MKTAHGVAFATIKAGSIAATADSNGNYSITVGEKQDYLIFSAVGYITTKVKIKNKNVINVIMKTRTAALQEVVVTDQVSGYASKKLAGKVSGVDALLILTERLHSKQGL